MDGFDGYAAVDRVSGTERAQASRCDACETYAWNDGWSCTRCGSPPATREGFDAFAPASSQSTEGFDSDQFALLAQLEAESFWFRARNSLIVWALSAHFPDAHRFLEIGCGTGFVLQGLRAARPGIELFASEILTEGLGFAARRCEGASLFQMDARRIPFVEEFDAVGAFDIIEHIREDTLVLRQINRALRPRGGVLLTVPQHGWLWSTHDQLAKHFRRYSKRELVSGLEHAGFEVVRATSFVSLLLPVMLLARLVARRGTPEADTLREYQMSRRISWPLERVLDIERTLIRAGVSFPIGASLLVVARKVRASEHGAGA